VQLALGLDRLRASDPGAPAPTLANVLRANGGQLKVAGWRFDVTQTRALATAQEDVKVDPARMATLTKVKAALNENLHQVQRVCI
jgi:hypothetical protein